MQDYLKPLNACIDALCDRICLLLPYQPCAKAYEESQSNFGTSTSHFSISFCKRSYRCGEWQHDSNCCSFGHANTRRCLCVMVPLKHSA